MSASFRSLPSVDALVQAAARAADVPRPLLVESARAILATARQNIAAGRAPAPDLVQAVMDRAQAMLTPSLRPVINASGVIIQTNLGRAPLSQQALAAMAQVGGGYANLEYDLERGERGSRFTHVTSLIQRLTGAEAALVVNNNAAAMYLVLLALAVGREVIVSRGQAVEIGGGFRIPDVLRQSGATLVEVGSTNRTYASDYAAAVTPQTALMMRIHTSNFRLVGFVHETPLADMVSVGRERGVLVVDDLGSGTLLPTAPHGLAPEPTVQESVAAGADLITFSGDKLLGGPQAGIIAGRADLIQTLKRHPLTRALRPDKATLAGLEATLLSYVRGTAHHDLPVWQMISTPIDRLRQRANVLARATGGQVVACESAVGGGSLPGETLPSVALAFTIDEPNRLARALRTGTPPIVVRITDGTVVFDLRTVLPAQDAVLLQTLQALLPLNQIIANEETARE